MRRRDFTLGAGATLAASALVSPEATSAPVKPVAGAPRTNFDPKAWHQRLKRIMQVNFNEKDAENFDVEAWADYLGSVRAQATFLSVTNIVAFYPTKLPDLPVSPFLKGRDLFGECARAAHKRNVRIMGRLSIETAHISLAESILTGSGAHLTAASPAAAGLKAIPARRPTSARPVSSPAITPVSSLP